MCDKLVGDTGVTLPRNNTELVKQFQRLVYLDVSRREKVKANLDDTIQWVWLGVFARHVLEKFWAKVLGFPKTPKKSNGSTLRDLAAWEIAQYLHIPWEVWEDLQARKFAGGSSLRRLPAPIKMPEAQDPLDKFTVFSSVDVINLIFWLDDSPGLRAELQIYDWDKVSPLKHWETKAMNPSLPMLTGYLMECVGRNVFLAHRTIRRKNQDVLVKCDDEGFSVIDHRLGYLNPEEQAGAREALYRMSADLLAPYLQTSEEIAEKASKRAHASEAVLDDIIEGLPGQQDVEDLYLHLCSSDDEVDTLPLPSTTVLRYVHQAVG